ETGALLEVVEILNSTLDAKQLLRRVAIKIARVCRVDRCSVAQWEGGEVTPLMAQYADGRKTPVQWAAFQGMASRLLHEIPATARALDTRRPVVVNDARESDLVPREWVETFALGSYLVVPLIRRDQVTGIMTLDYCERPTRFEPWQVDLAMTIAGQLALALANARLYTEAQERLRETTTLMSVAQILSRPEPVAERMRQVAHGTAVPAVRDPARRGRRRAGGPRDGKRGAGAPDRGQAAGDGDAALREPDVLLDARPPGPAAPLPPSHHAGRRRGLGGRLAARRRRRVAR